MPEADLDLEPRIGIGAGSGQARVEGPDLEPGAARRRPGDPRAGKAHSRFFMSQIALRAKEKGVAR